MGESKFLPISCFLTALILFLSTTSVTAIAQEQKGAPCLRVKVVGYPKEEGIGWASMWSLEGERVVKVSYAKSDGSITWRAPAAGSYKLLFQADGFLSDTLSVVLCADTTLGRVILFPDLEEGSVELGEVVKIAERPLLTQFLDRWVYDVSRDPEARSKKMVDIIDKIPQMNSNTPDGRLEYGGEKLEELLIDGERHEMVNVRTQFPMALIRGDVMDKIEVIPPGSPQYNNSGYILNIITSRALPNGYAVEVKGEGATNNLFGGDFNIVSKIRDKVVLRFGYGVNYGNTPKLNSYSFREHYGEGGALLSSIESKTQSWNTLERHNVTVRGSTKILGGDLNFGIRTSMGESGRTTEVKSSGNNFNGGEEVALRQFSKTVSTDRTTPRVSGDLRYLRRKGSDRNSQLIYQYNDNRSSSLQQLNRSEEFLNLEPLDREVRWEIARASQSHAARWIDRWKVGDLGVKDPYGFGGHWLRYSLNYDNRHYQQEQFEELSVVGGLEYRQQIIGLSPTYEFRSMKFQSTINGSLEYESDRGTFLSSGNPLRYSQLTFNPSAWLTTTVIPKAILQLRYSRRSVRPSFGRLDPYLIDIDPNNLVTGNPQLTPEKIDRLTILLTKTIKGSSKPLRGVGKRVLSGTNNNVELGFTYELISNAIEQVTILQEDGVTITTFDNIGSRDRYSVSLSSSLWLLEKVSLNMKGGYTVQQFRSGNPNIGHSRIGGVDGELYLSARFWPTGNTTFGYRNSSNLGLSQASMLFYNHYFKFAHSQVLIKSKLFASIEVSNPFKPRMTIHNQISGLNFKMDSWQEQFGRVVLFSLRWNFGRLKERVGEAEKLDDDRSRD